MGRRAPSSPCVELKERDAVGLGDNLRLMATGGQGLAGRFGQRCGAPGRTELARKEIRDERLGSRIGRVVDDETVWPEQRFEPPREGVGHAHAGPVRGTKRGHQRFGKLGLAERIGELVEAVLDPGIQRQRRDRSLAGALWFRQRDRVRLEARIEHRTARDLIPVVIFGIDPEDRNDVGLMIVRGPAGELDGGDGFQQREERAAEGPRLLPGKNRDRSGVGEFLRGFASGGGGPAAGLLRGQEGRDSRAGASQASGPGDRVAPGLAGRRVAGVERRDLGEVKRVVAGERPDPAKTAHVDRSAGRAVGERRFRLHRLVLSQSPAKHVKATISTVRRMSRVRGFHVGRGQISIFYSFSSAGENRDLTPGKPCYIFSHVDSGACARRQEAGAP